MAVNLHTPVTPPCLQFYRQTPPSGAGDNMVHLVCSQQKATTAVLTSVVGPPSAGPPAPYIFKLLAPWVCPCLW